MSSDPDAVRKISARNSSGIAMLFVFVRYPLAIEILNIAACSVAAMVKAPRLSSMV